MDFDSKIFEQDNIKPEESIHVLQSRDSNVGFKKDRFSIIPNDDRYNEIYTRPGKIINKVLIERSNADCDQKRTNCAFIESNPGSEESYNLKNHLQELHDYILVSQESWKMFSSWYGYDYEINYGEGRI